MTVTRDHAYYHCDICGAFRWAPVTTTGCAGVPTL